LPFSTDDTIVAIATPAGRGGIGVVRISGPGALQCASALTGHEHFQPRHATLVRVTGADAADQAIATWFQAPASYTGEHVVEISAHGSPVLLRSIVRAAIAAGARLAEPGEFTLRAYLSGRMDLVQAEAVADLVNAVTPLQARAAFDQLEGTLTHRVAAIDAALFDLSARLEASLDFPDEGYHFVEPSAVASEIDDVRRQIESLLADARLGRMIREGAQVVIAGRPNVGKSTLFNALAGAGRAIVTDIPGTTRDLLTEAVEIEGLAVTLVDTAGIHGHTADAVESEGVSRARRAAEHADLALVVLDQSAPLGPEDQEILDATSARDRVIVASKADLPAAWNTSEIPSALAVAAVSGAGLEELRAAIARTLAGRDVLRDGPAITNMRHVTLLQAALTALTRARDAADRQTPEEFVAADIAEARAALEEVTGRRTADDTLNEIFSRFCIGK